MKVIEDFHELKLDAELYCKKLYSYFQHRLTLIYRYKAPEMIRYDIACPASDIWALGIILFQCLTGKHPFNLDNSSDRAKVERNI